MLNTNNPEGNTNMPSPILGAKEYEQSPLQVTWHGIVRAIGVCILLFGLWMAYQVVRECWSLYSDPSKIGQFAQFIAKDSNIDKSVEQIFQEVLDEVKQNNPNPNITTLQFSYFIAWFFCIVLLFMIGRIAFWAIATGSSMATEHADQEQMAKAIAREVISTAFVRLEAQNRK